MEKKEKVNCPDGAREAGLGHKPRICEVLGVEVGERFRVVDHENGYDTTELFINEYGEAEFTRSKAKLPPAILTIHAVNHPDSIIREPRFTEEEKADAKTILRIFSGTYKTVERNDRDGLVLADEEGWKRGINKELFPSLRPGQSVKLEDIPL